MEWFLKNRREGGTEKRKKQRQGTLTGHKWRDNTLREFLQTSKQTFRNFSISKSTVLKGQVNTAITVKQAPEAIRPWSQLFQVKHYEAKSAPGTPILCPLPQSQCCFFRNTPWTHKCRQAATNAGSVQARSI